MNFPFNPPKATEVACEFLRKAGGQMNIMKMVKLLYLLDRLSIDKRGIPVVGGAYLSMKNGPVTSEVLELINSGRLDGVDDHSWEVAISSRLNHQVKLEGDPPNNLLSRRELAMIGEVWQLHGAKDQWQLVTWCHDNCSEWTELDEGRASISIEGIADALGKSTPEKQHILSEAKSSAVLDRLFA